MDKSTRRMEACRAAEYEATAQKLQVRVCARVCFCVRVCVALTLCMDLQLAFLCT